MTSILTNNGAMVALQTLRGINNELGTVQEQISTGKKVGTAQDNAAVWAISKTMEADVSGFGKVSEGLAVAESTVGVARNGAEKISDLLKKARDSIIQAQDPAQDGAKIQEDINAISEQIKSVVASAQFNGVNLLDSTSGGATMDVLASLNRDGTGVSAGKISIDRQDLRVEGLEKVATADLADRIDVATTPITAGGTSGVTIGGVTAPAAGDVFKLTIGSVTKSFTATADDDADSMAAKIAGAFSGGDITASVAAGVITFTNNGATDLDVVAEAYANTGGAGGGLAALSTIDVTTPANATAALGAIDALITMAIDAAAAFGTAQNQLKTQNEFVSQLADTMKMGIGAMVDADMEEASARLKALQTQQQLGIQSLSIANQAPSSVMALFR